MPSRSIAHRQSAPRRCRMTAGYRLFLGLPFNLWAIVYLYLTSDNLPYEKIGNDEPVSIADEIPFDIPDSWEWVRLGAVIELQSGQDMTPDKYNDCGKGIPYITGASNIENGNVLINRWTEYGRAFAYCGDILLTCKGTVGTMAVLQEPQVHIARQIMAVRPISELYVPYLQLVLDTLVENLKAAAKTYENHRNAQTIKPSSLAQIRNPPGRYHASFPSKRISHSRRKWEGVIPVFC